MKIDYVVIGSNTNPLYLDFWPLISKIWKTVFDITPVLGLICDEDSDLAEDAHGLVKKFKCIDDSSDLQSQIVRLYLPTLLHGNILISDIDMLPLSRKYFIDDVKTLDENKFYIFSSDNPECLQNLEYPMCYNLGHSDLYKKIFNIPKEWNLFVEQIKSLNAGWCSDQRFLYQKVNSYRQINPEDIVLMNRGWSSYGPANNRIDRLFWNYIPENVTQGYYIDCHMLRPYLSYKNDIDTLVSFLSEGNK